MNIGTVIFLAALIFLYLHTRDRWSWKKILKRLFLGIVTISSLIGICVLGVNYYQKKPKVITQLKEIELGITTEDVIFTQGAPNEKSTIKSDDDLLRVINYGNTRVFLKENKVYIVEYFCKTNDRYSNTDYTELNGIRCGDDAAKIIDKFGNNIETLNHKDDPLLRDYKSTKHNSGYTLVTNKVRAMYIKDYGRK